MRGGAERIFLGWDGSALDRAAEWILERHGEDEGSLLVALPGSRAARALREKLALRAKPSWTPPRILTQGELIDEMVLLDRPVAGRLARTLAWARALSDLPHDRLERLAVRPPEKGDLRGALALAETVRALHAELAQEGIGFDRLARGEGRPASAGEAARFEVLADAQARWRKILDGLGLADPHESRFRAIDAGAIDAGAVDGERKVVLVGVADMNRLLRHLVLRLGPRATALVFAPPEEAGAFDELGCLRTAAWKDRDLPLPLDRWHVVDGPDAQAERAVEILASFDARFAPEEVTIGLCDEEVAPHLERRLGEEGVLAHHAAGTPLELTRPFRLLAELSAWLPRRAFAPYAALLRHPDLERSLRAHAGEVDVAAALDGYHELHLPGLVDGHWLGGREQEIRSVHAGLLDLLGQLSSADPRPLAAWPPPLRAFLTATYPDPLDPAAEEERILAGALSVLSDALGEIERLPGALGTTPASAAEAVELALSISRGESVSPRPPAPGEAVIEMLGWLELPLDEAGALVVTGFQEGFVPRSRRDDPFLPDGLRRKLGLPCADDRVARDLYAATVLLASKKEVAFVSGRRNRQGDPLLPSRLAFHAPREEILARFERSKPREESARIAALDPARSAAFEPPRRSALEPARSSAPSDRDRYRLPRLEPTPKLESMRVTSFGEYLRSPYGFYLKHVLGVDTLDDAAREMDPRALGSLAHAVLEEFGRSDLADSTDAKAIERWMREKVAGMGRWRFGARPLPAVGLQLAQLARRFEFFARAQARRAEEGWRIQQVEWKPEGTVRLLMGEPEAPMLLHGKIDRIDVRERVRERSGSSEPEWAILDYKTGSSAKDPEKVHRTRGVWRDLQLPLYTLLANELGFESQPSLGYFSVGKDEAETRVALAKWGPDDLENAFEAGREVVQRVRAGEFFDLGRDFADPRRSPILLALAGKGLVETAEEGSDGEGGDGEEGDG